MHDRTTIFSEWRSIKPMVPAHPVRQQEVGAVVLAAAAAPAVQGVRVAVPLGDRQLVVWQYDERLRATEAVRPRIDWNVLPMRVADRPADGVHRDLLQRSQ